MKKILTLLFAIIASAAIHAQQEINIQVGEDVIHLKTFGKGQPLLIINGGPGFSSEGFISLAKILSKSAKAIIYDQRGTGKSTIDGINSSTITMDLMVKDIETIRKYLEIEEWVVMGHSFGGMLASYYASKHPNRINGLILSSSGGIDLDLFSNLDVNGRLTRLERDSMNYWQNQLSRGDTTYFARLQRARYLAPAYVYDKSHVNTIAERLTQGNMRINGLVFQNMQKIGFDCVAELRTFPSPVLILQGKDDIINKRIAQKAHTVFKNSKLVLMEKCGHYGWLDQPEIYFPEIRDFLRLIQ